MIDAYTAAQGLLGNVDERSGLNEYKDLLDDDDELWETAMAGVADNPQGAVVAQSVEDEDLLDDDDELWDTAMAEDEDLLDDDDELWDTAMAGVADNLQGAVAVQPVEDEDLLDDDNELWDTAMASVADSP
ncbi:hypothetical protein KVR01_000263 [Diaporthe batatas]|uniref:uncharacterized protein n=1 Tax=Diaporthe batatas TaxID=748121 RepID=UPI001D03808D|nr:uncharacterized protein KVR01_000263 [Diaporthe batatas]KAG8169518.1 hypothetical protein KVR01_000263 [Diaporthe batatas]